MSETELRSELEQASAHLRPRMDAQAVWDLGARARRRHRTMAVAGVATAATAVVIGGVTVRSIDFTAPDPRPEATIPTPPDDSVPARSIPYLTEDQVQPAFDPADLESVPWDEASGVRSWDPVDPVPLADDPVEHAAVAVQSDVDEPDAISVLGDDGRWRSLDLTGIELSDSVYESGLGVSRGSLSPDGTRLALGQADGVVVVDLTTGESSTYDVSTLGARWQGREVAWSPDASTIYVDSTAATTGVAVDVATGDTHPVPFNVGASAFLDDGQVIEDFFSMRTGSEIRVYDADGERVFLAPNDIVLDALEYVAGRGDRWAAQRINAGWNTADPRGPNAPATGIFVLDPPARPAAMLPVKGWGPTDGGGGAVLGWRGDDTVLFQHWRGADSYVAFAWAVESERVTRVAEYTSSGPMSIVADYLPTG